MRKITRERRARARARLDLQPALVAVDDMLDDGETKAGAADLAALLDADPVEPLGDARQVLALDARPEIAHLQIGEVLDRKGAARDPEGWEKFEDVTSNVPFMAITQERNRLALGEIGWRGLAGVAIAVAIAVFHRQLFGVAAFST